MNNNAFSPAKRYSNLRIGQTISYQRFVCSNRGRTVSDYVESGVIVRFAPEGPIVDTGSVRWGRPSTEEIAPWEDILGVSAR
jgi:hypothetical protein